MRNNPIDMIAQVCAWSGMAKKDQTVNVPISRELKGDFDAWWRRQPVITSLAAAVRMLMQEAIDKGDRPRID